MDRRYIIIIWHQAGLSHRGKDTPTYYTLNDESTECALVFGSEAEAKEFWNEHRLNQIHAGFVVEATTAEVEWI